jgi:MoxR-like ATPase
MSAVREFASRVRSAVEQAIIGKSETINMVIAALLSGGHILFEDYPGLGKTLLARTLAQSTELEFSRIQFTPDLLPSDITGGHIFNREASRFELHRGPLFTNVLLADELNRASPKTQSALLEAMQERQVTLAGETLVLPQPFTVLATQNPIEYEGTFPLPEAQLDRFLVKLSIGYPGHDDEVRILQRRRERKADEHKVEPVTDSQEVIGIMESLEEVFIHGDLENYIVRIVAATREHSGVSVGASPRASLAIMKLSRAIAAMSGRGYIVPDDVKLCAGPALCHRIVLSPDLWLREGATGEIVNSIIRSIPVPVIPKA